MSNLKCALCGKEVNYAVETPEDYKTYIECKECFSQHAVAIPQLDLYFIDEEPHEHDLSYYLMPNLNNNPVAPNPSLVELINNRLWL